MAIEEVIKKNWELVPLGIMLAGSVTSLYYAFRAYHLKIQINQMNKDIKTIGEYHYSPYKTVK